MSKPYHIITDAAADFDVNLARQEDLKSIPMVCTVGDEERIYDSFESEDAYKEYYNAQREGKETRTTQISPQMYIDYFRPFAERGENILYIALSSGLSNTYNSSLMAAEELAEEFPDAKIRCVDSLGATIGMGRLIEIAYDNRRNGMSLEENAKNLEDVRLSVCHWFVVDDLMFLKRGGRLPAATAAVGTLLNIKPILRIENDGTLTNFVKKRGSRMALDHLISLYDNGSEKPEGERLLIVHADNESGAEYLKEQALKINPTAVIHTRMLTPIIGCHVGPGMCAIVHLGKRIQ